MDERGRGYCAELSLTSLLFVQGVPKHFSATHTNHEINLVLAPNLIYINKIRLLFVHCVEKCNFHISSCRNKPYVSVTVGNARGCIFVSFSQEKGVGWRKEVVCSRVGMCISMEV